MEYNSNSSSESDEPPPYSVVVPALKPPFDPDKLLALHVDQVHSFVEGHKNKVLPAQVAVLDYDHNVIFKKKIFHPPYSFQVDGYTRHFNWYRECDFVLGDPIEKVKNSLNRILNGNIVLVWDKINILRNLDVNTRTFDLQTLFLKKVKNCYGKEIEQRQSFDKITEKAGFTVLNHKEHQADCYANGIMSLYQFYVNKHKPWPMSWICQ